MYAVGNVVYLISSFVFQDAGIMLEITRMCQIVTNTAKFMQILANYE